MKRKKSKPKNTTKANKPSSLPKSPTGVEGLDEILGGGLPTARPTLVCGSAGAGKTMLALEFLVHGAVEYNEPGVFVMFEENAAEIAANVGSLGVDLKKLTAQKKIVLDHVQVEASEIEETGKYDLEGLFIRVGYAVDSIGAKRIVFDTLEALFSAIPNHAILRAELRRLFHWLKNRGLTAIITGERGEASLTRYGLEEYVADCVIVLDHRVTEQISTRRLRVVKYRGSAHGTNEYPFLITERGLSVLPITSLRLDHEASNERVATGIPQLDDMFDGKGLYRGSSILVSGSAGSGKSSVSAAFVEATCKRGERALLFAYEESSSQLLRNMRSIGIDLEPWINKGLLQIHASRPTLQGLEQHLVTILDLAKRFRPTLIAIDPITNLALDMNDVAIKATMMRLIDFLKAHHITAVYTSLTESIPGGGSIEASQAGVSSLMDTWLLLRNVEYNGERNRTLYVLKSRGMAHSNQVREFVLTKAGIKLIEVYLGNDRILTGSARIAQEAAEAASNQQRNVEYDAKLRRLQSKHKAIAAQIASLEAESASDLAELSALEQDKAASVLLSSDHAKSMARQRSLDKGAR